jgi:hypothetical protein
VRGKKYAIDANFNAGNLAYAPLSQYFYWDGEQTGGLQTEMYWSTAESLFFWMG